MRADVRTCAICGARVGGAGSFWYHLADEDTSAGGTVHAAHLPEPAPVWPPHTEVK